ncbi:wall-associated receptor kinase-like 8 [Lactuca sativa]|uniref:wall-associated receptor kinase-like 8 n=1 Tax=Lactuca sativa TaxID=4236 RepID=UPI000CA9B0E7|nr:wall-associated receptor kinase-like 8 [Lactuca sativa]
MKSLQLSLVILISLALAPISTPIYARPGCTDMCGKIRIPYPFGIGTGCYINEWYAVDCNSSTPYLSAINNLELLSLNLENQTMAVNFSMNSDCVDTIRNNSQILSVDLGESPFLFSREDNKFTVEGCENAVILDQGGNLVTGCSTICQNQTTNQRDDCYGVNCCQTTIPYYLKAYTIDTTSLQRQSPGGVCGSAFVVDEQMYLPGRFSGKSAIFENSFVPISLRWTLRPEEIGESDCSSMARETLYLGNGTNIESYKCNCRPIEEGSPYLTNGCQVVKECATCIGECQVYQGNITCIPNPLSQAKRKSSTLGVILGVSISFGVLLLVAIIFALYKLLKKTKDKRQKARFFKRNGGLLLKQQESADEGIVNKTTLFTAKELEKATDHFHENRILGRGGQGTVYKGMLTDGRIVAVKRSKIVDESQLEQFINEVVILSQVNHRNVVKLLGCCLETEVPLLVSEFVSNGTLYEQIHNETDEFPMTLNTRLRIATEIAGALAYLHSATSIP